MTLLQFLLTFVIMILIGSPFIMGWYIITRGEWYPRPDGSWEKYGMIFKEWSLFWEQYRNEKRVYFDGEELIKKCDLLKKVRPDLSEKFRVTGALGLNYKTAHELTKIQEEQIVDILACELEKSGGGAYKLFIVEPVYLFPSWIRKPLSACPPCMSSVYGSAMYWFVVLQVPDLFSWSSKENLAKFGFWVIFCLILACGNKYLDQKLKLNV